MAINQPTGDRGSGQHPGEIVKDIRNLMERSSRFISLSGLSGIAAGLCGIVGAWLAARQTGCWRVRDCLFNRLRAGDAELERNLSWIAIGTFVLAFTGAFFFTSLRSKKTGTPLWGPAAKRLLWNLALPLIAGALFIYRMISTGQYELIGPASLLFYGLALVNASRFTLGEIRYLGYAEIALGLINAWFPEYSLPFWMAGFGVLHVLYGGVMWWRNEREGPGVRKTGDGK